MWSSRLFWKVFLVYAGLNLALAIGFMVAVSHFPRQLAAEQMRHRLRDTGHLICGMAQRSIESGDFDSLQRLVTEQSSRLQMHLTVVDTGGNVLADSHRDPRQLANHFDRPEFQEAVTTGEGEEQRSFQQTPMLYRTVRVLQADRPVAYVRVGADMSRLESYAERTRNVLWTMVAAVGVLALVLTYAVVGQIVRPLGALIQGAKAIAAGDYSKRVTVDRRDELGVLSDAFNAMRVEMASRMHELTANGERLSTVLSSMVEGVIAVDREERVILANAAGRSLLSFVTPDAVGRPLREVTRSLPVHEAVSQTFKSEGPHRCEFEVSGAHRRVLSLWAGRIPGDPPPGVVVVLHDVTDLRRLENLRQEFVANVSHELKTPLAAIKAYAETLRIGAMCDEQHRDRFVQRIEEQADRLHALILDMLRLARMESGKEAFEITDVDLAAAVDACVSQRAQEASLKHITLQIDRADQNMRVRADEEGLRTILNNLVDNAIKYTPEGGQVTVRWSRNGTMAVLQVADNGIGIAREDQNRIFERFYRVDRARSRELGGTGLGLSIVKHLAQSFGGSVALESRPSEGSTFEVQLPLA